MPRRKKNPPAAPEENASPPEIKKTPRRRNFEKQLASIYAGEPNGSPIISAPRRRPKNKIFFGLLILFAFLGVVSWFGFFFFDVSQKFSEEKIEIKINGPAEARNGQEINYLIYIKNRQRLALANSIFELRFPENFLPLSVIPSASGEDGRRWNLGAIPGNKEIFIEIKGKIFGEAETDVSLRAFLTYRPANFNADFQKNASFDIRLKSAPVEITISGAERMSAGEEADFKISILNQGDEAAKNLELTVSYPSFLKINSFAPAPFRENVWKIGELAGGESSTVRIKTVATAGKTDSPSSLKAEIYQDGEKGKFKQKTTEKIIALSAPNFSLSLSANNSAEKQTVNFGEKINFAVSWQNSENFPLKNGSVKAVIEAPFDGEKSIFNWTLLDDKKDGDVVGEQVSPTVRRGTVSWNKKNVPALAEIKPQDRQTLEFSLPLKTNESVNLARVSEYKIIVYAELAAETAAKKPFKLVSPSLTLILNTDLSLSLQSAFKEKKNLAAGENQGMDAENSYRLTWNIANSLHEVMDLQLTAILPENAEWKNITEISAGEISFDPKTRRVLWTLNRLPTTAAKASVSFEAAFKYSSKEAGMEKTLLEKTQLTAKDKVTGEELLLVKEPLKIKL